LCHKRTKHTWIRRLRLSLRQCRFSRGSPICWPFVDPVLRDSICSVTGEPMSSVSPIAKRVTELAGSFGGELLQRADSGYEEARRVHNGLVDKRPALIARCAGVADICDTVNLARNLNLEVAIRGGGHNVAGRATIADGLMIDLSTMKGIHVDPRNRTGRAQGGPDSIGRPNFTAWPRLAASSPPPASLGSP
jgi:FAD binding domain